MKRIFKYELTSAESILEIEMPFNAEVLTVQRQSDTIQLWAKVNTENKIEKRYFQILMTGEDIEPDEYERKYISTIQLGLLVLHIFEVIK